MCPSRSRWESKTPADIVRYSPPCKSSHLGLAGNHPPGAGPGALATPSPQQGDGPLSFLSAGPGGPSLDLLSVAPPGPSPGVR